MYAALIALLAYAGPGDQAHAQAPETAPRDLRVGLSSFPPFVITQPTPTGYSVDLWTEIAARIGRPYRFVECEGVAAKLEKVRRGELDVAIGGLTTSAEREAQVDFTHPVYRSGLAIMLPGPADDPPLWSRVGNALAATNSGVIIAFFVVVLVAGHLIWFIERGRDSFDERYLPGVFEGIYWAMVTASTVGYGDKAPVKATGRVLAMLVIVISLPMFALFTAELASAFTLQSITASVRGPEDLQGRRVGVIRGTSAAKFAAQRGLSIRQWDRAQDVYEGLAQGKVAAVIYDAPSLKYYAQTDGADSVHMVRRSFDIRDLALATPQGSPLREQINRVLLELEASGKLTELRAKWFGGD